MKFKDKLEILEGNKIYRDFIRSLIHRLVFIM